MEFYNRHIIVTGGRDDPSLEYVLYSTSRNELEEDIGRIICTMHDQFTLALTVAGLYHVRLDRNWYVDEIDGEVTFNFPLVVEPLDKLREMVKVMTDNADGGQLLEYGGWTILDNTYEYGMIRSGYAPNGEPLVVKKGGTDESEYKRGGPLPYPQIP